MVSNNAANEDLLREVYPIGNVAEFPDKCVYQMKDHPSKCWEITPLVLRDRKSVV